MSRGVRVGCVPGNAGTDLVQASLAGKISEGFGEWQMSRPERFSMQVEVNPEHIDVMGHVNNVVYLQWVQDVAVAHWFSRAPQADQERLLWVVARHEIDYKRPAMPGDQLRVETWVGSATARAFQRHTEITRANDNKLLARALTIWCPVDPETKRPTDVSDAVREAFSIPDAHEPR